MPSVLNSSQTVIFACQITVESSNFQSPLKKLSFFLGFFLLLGFFYLKKNKFIYLFIYCLFIYLLSSLLFISLLFFALVSSQN